MTIQSFIRYNFLSGKIIYKPTFNAIEMLKISWISKTGNDEMLNSIGPEQELLHEIKVRKTSYLNHILSHNKYEFFETIIQGKV